MVLISFNDLLYRLNDIGNQNNNITFKPLLIFPFQYISRLNEIFLVLISKYWKGKIRSRLNDIFIVSISFLFFLVLISNLFFCFNFNSILYHFNV